MYKKPKETAKVTETGGIYWYWRISFSMYSKMIVYIDEYFDLVCFTCLRWFNGWYTR